MIGNIITDPSTGEPLNNQGQKLSKSAYQPSKEITDLFSKAQQDYQIAYALQHRSFKEFDGYSLLDRTRMDQELFGAFVGAEYLPVHKRWRWKGRKNTARNKLIAILSRAIAGMLYPIVHATNDSNEEDKMSARVMGILIENHLKKARYDVNFLFLVLSALVNPAVFCAIEYVEKMQTVKQRLANGEVKIIQVVDELLSGLALSSVPVDEILLPDFYSGTGELRTLPNIIRLRRIPWDLAKDLYKGKYFDAQGKDQFDYVQAGMTRIFLAANENQTLYDIEWTEADRNYVQEITVYYRSEDLEVKFVGGVFMGNMDNVYNTNPFEHRRLVLADGPSGQEWVSIPVYKYVMSGFEPLDPAGRFAYFKSAAFKEYWDDLTLNKMHQLLIDGTYLDVIKPMFLSGVSKVDSTVMVPGATIGMPSGAQATPYQLGPNLAAAMTALKQQEADMSDSTKSDPISDEPTPGVTATQTQAAVAQARLFFGVFSIMLASLVEQVGALAMDCVIQYTTVGEVDASLPEALTMKFKTYLAKGKDKGKNVTNRIVFTDKHYNRSYTEESKKAYDFSLFDKEGGKDADQRIYEVSPYYFARRVYTTEVDAEQILSKSMGADEAQKQRAFNMLTDPRVLPFTDPEAVANDFVIEEYGGADPDKYKRKSPMPDDMLSSIMGGQGSAPVAPGGAGVVTPPQAGRAR